MQEEEEDERPKPQAAFLPPPPQPPAPAKSMEKSFIEDEDGFVKPANKEPSRASQADQPSLGPGASVKDIAKNIQLPIMGMGNRNQMLLEKKKKEEEERRRRAQEEEEEYERQKEEQARDRALRASNVSQQQVIAQAEP